MVARRVLVAVVACAVSLGIGTWNLAQEKTEPKQEGKKTKTKKTALPDYFGQIGLSPTQEEDVRKAAEPFDKKMAELRTQIAALQKQLQQLDAERTAACEEKLTDGQKTALKERRTAAAAEKAAKAKKTGDAKKTEKTEASK
jgi:septal ring factor EnvC (AmiA/AmiB activator)